MLCHGEDETGAVSELQGIKPERPKQIIGTDVFGPLPTSPNGYRYCLVVVCYYSGYGYVFPLRNKSEAVQTLKALIQRMENAESAPSAVEVYVSDHGG